MKINVAIDGPAGSGKSSISKAVAKRLGFIYVDTGALYRAVGLKLLRQGISADDEQEVKEILDKTSVNLRFIDGEQRVLLDGEDVSGQIRTPEASMMASKCSALPVVRAFLLQMQRDIAKNNPVIMDGRDIGTVVLPDAEVKIFMTASLECRAKRRYKELLLKGQKVDYDDVLADMEKRDYDDSHRAAAPLKPSDDSVLADTTELSLEESVELIADIVNKALNSYN